MPTSDKSLIDKLRQMAGGFSLTQILYTAVRLRVAEQLANGHKGVQELAQVVKASEPALYRFLRMMAVVGLLVQNADRSFQLTPLGRLLDSNHPDSMYKRILYIGEINYPAAQGMLYAVQTGETAFKHIFGVPFFDYLAERPQAGELFNDLMSRGVNDRVAGIVSTYDFSAADLVVDIGGGNGTLIAAILLANPSLRGIIFDVPKVTDEARDYLAKNGVVDRCQTINGDFFKDAVPRGGDIYILSNIIHDWDDTRAVQILRNCHGAMSAGSKLLLVEEIMPDNVTDAPVTVAGDFSMLLLTGGQERTKADYQSLLSTADLRLTTVIPFEATRTYNKRKPNWAIIESKIGS